MWRAALALGLGVLLALAADQAIPLLVPPPPEENRHWYLQTVRYHPVLGWSGVPGFAGTKDGIPIRTNSLGYRDREPVGTDSGRPGVLFLGDSFTWGDEVRAEERFTSLLEMPCGAACDSQPPIRSVNRGIIGYGTAQSFLDYLLAPDARGVEVVILALYTGNDLADNAEVDSPSGPRPRLIRCDPGGADHELCVEGVPVPPAVDWPEHRVLDPRGGVVRTFGWSGLVTLASQRRAPGFLIEDRIGDQMDGIANAVPFPSVERTSAAPVEDRIGQLEAILRAMNRAVRGSGRSFGVLVFPSARAYAGDPERELDDYARILAVLDRLGIPFADYHARTKHAGVERLYSGIQGHWRPAGHQEAAALVRPLLATLRAQRPASAAIAPRAGLAATY